MTNEDVSIGFGIDLSDLDKKTSSFSQKIEQVSDKIDEKLTPAFDDVNNVISKIEKSLSNAFMNPKFGEELISRIENISKTFETNSEKIINAINNINNKKIDPKEENKEKKQKENKIEKKEEPLNTNDKLLDHIKSIEKIITIKYLIDGIEEAINKTIELNKQIFELKTLTGLNTSESIGLNYALKASGVSIEEYSSALGQISSKIKEQPGLLEAYGVKIKDNNGNLLSADEIMKNSINTLNNYKAGTDRNTASTVIFGEEINKLTKLSKALSLNQKEFSDISDKLNSVIGEDGSNSINEYTKNITKIGIVFDFIRKSIAIPFIKTINDISSILINSSSDVVGFFSSSSNALSSIFEDLFGIFKTIFETVYFLIDNFLKLFETILTGGSNSEKTINGITRAINYLLIGIKTVSTFIDVGFKTMQNFGKGLIGFLSGDKNAFKDAIDETSNYAENKIKNLSELISKNNNNINDSKNEDKKTEDKKTEKSGTFEDIKRQLDIQKQIADRKKQFSESQINIEKINNQIISEMNEDLYKNNLELIIDYFNKRKELINNDYNLNIKSLEAEKKALQTKKGLEIDSVGKAAIETQILEIDNKINEAKKQKIQLDQKEGIERKNAINERNKFIESLRIELQLNSEQNALNKKRNDYNELNRSGKLSNLELDKKEIEIAQEQFDLDKKIIDEKINNNKNDYNSYNQLINDKIKLEQDYSNKVIELQRKIREEESKEAIETNKNLKDAFDRDLNDFLNNGGKIIDVFKSLIRDIFNEINKKVVSGITSDMFGNGSSNGSSGYLGGIGAFLTKIFSTNPNTTGASGAAETVLPTVDNPFLNVDATGLEGLASYSAPSLSYGSNNLNNDKVQANQYKNTNSVSVVNNLTLSGLTDKRTQTQIANAASRSVIQSSSRN